MERRINMKFMSWNVNGFRAALRHGFVNTFMDLDADIFGIQDTRLHPDELSVDLPGYYQYWNYAERKGYAGTAVFTKEKPITVANGFGVPEVDGEGRSITLEFSNFYFINVQVPFSGEKLQRLDFRELWAQTFRNYVTKLMQYKPVIIGGDMSVAHERIDLAEPDDNHHRPGFTGIERKEFSELLNAGFIDTFRYFHPDEAKYTYWSYRDKEARAENLGWRLDYFLVSNNLEDKLTNAKILSNIMGSDHCPIELDVDVTTR